MSEGVALYRLTLMNFFSKTIFLLSLKSATSQTM